MKRIISFSLFLSLILSMSLPSFAFNPETTTKPIFLSVGSTYVEKIEGGSVLSQRTSDKFISITAQDIEHILNISIRYVDIPNSIYQWTFYDYPVPTFNPEDSRFWSEIIDYAENRKEEANIITFSCDTTEVFPETRSSATADLKEDLKSLHGIEYPYPDNPGIFLSRRTLYNHAFEIRETKTFHIVKQRSFSWKDGLTVAGVLTNVLGLAFTSGIATTVCSVLGLVYTGASMILPAAKIQSYSCSVQYYRYVTIDKDGREYTGAFRNVTYSGYEDISPNSAERAYIVKETKYESYPQSEEYYNDYDAMYEEAYEYYKWTPGNT